VGQAVFEARLHAPRQPPREPHAHVLLEVAARLRDLRRVVPVVAQRELVAEVGAPAPAPLEGHAHAGPEYDAELVELRTPRVLGPEAQAQARAGAPVREPEGVLDADARAVRVAGVVARREEVLVRVAGEELRGPAGAHREIEARAKLLEQQ